MKVYALGACHPACPFCAREFFAWLKSRMATMNRPRDGEPSFAAAAATSIRPEPNLQNIPVHSEPGHAIRRSFRNPR